MIIVNCEQGTEKWFKARCGIPSASNFDKIVDTKGNPSKQRLPYAYRVAGERVTGKQEETYQNSAMKRGTEMESEARQLYEMMNGVEVEQVGFCKTEGKAVYGASPDGLILEDGEIEIKCPLLATHVSYLLKSEKPSKYFQQVQGQLLVTGRKWCDFMSYYPGMKPLIVRVLPDKEFIKKLKVELELFCKEVDDIVEEIK